MVNTNAALVASWAQTESTQPVGGSTCLLVGGAKLEGRVAGRDVAVQCVALELGQHVAAGESRVAWGGNRLA